MYKRCLEGVWMVSGTCLEGVCNVFGGYQEGCQEVFWNMSGECLEGGWKVYDQIFLTKTFLEQKNLFDQKKGR